MDKEDNWNKKGFNHGTRADFTIALSLSEEANSRELTEKEIFTLKGTEIHFRIYIANAIEKRLPLPEPYNYEHLVEAQQRADFDWRDYNRLSNFVNWFYRVEDRKYLKNGPA